MRVLFTILTLATTPVIMAEDQPLIPAISEELRQAGLAKLKAAMETYPMPGGVFIDTAVIPPQLLEVPPEPPPLAKGPR